MSKGNNSSYRNMRKSQELKDTHLRSSNQENNQIASSKTRSRLFKQMQIIGMFAAILRKLGRLVSSWSKVAQRFSAIFAIAVATILGFRQESYDREIGGYER